MVYIHFLRFDTFQMIHLETINHYFSQRFRNHTSTWHSFRLSNHYKIEKDRITNRIEKKKRS